MPRLKLPARVAFAIALLGGFEATSAHAQPVVAVTQIVEHAALDAVRKGLIDGLAAAGFNDGKEIRIQFQSAQGSPVTAGQIAQKFAGDAPAVIVAISTPSAQTVVAANKQVPVIFGAVTDPVGAKLVPNLERPGANVSGMSAFPPVVRQIELLEEMVPTAKRIGIMYNAGEANSVAIVAAAKAYLKTKPFTLVETTVTKTSEVGAAAEFLVGKVDAIFLPGDNTVFSTLEAVMRVTQAAKLVTVCGDPSAPARGCTAGLGYDWYASGRELAERVTAVLKGTPVGTIPVEGAKKVELNVNLKSATAMGVQVPESVLKRANNVLR